MGLDFKEHFLHYLWKTGNFNHTALQTTTGLPITIIHAGHHNHDSGPDFKNAQIQIDNVLWTGNVEIHKTDKEWTEHQHNLDPAYENVILHVVYNHNPKFVLNKTHTLELKHHIAPGTLERYGLLELSNHTIPCRNLVGDVDSIYKNAWLDRMLAERLQNRNISIENFIETEGINWSQLCYELTGRSFGFSTNSDVFQRLTRHIDQKLLRWHHGNQMQIEALLFGCSGLLPLDAQDEYTEQMQKEWKFLKAKYKLNEMAASEWKFSKMRPSNFPSIRIAQFAALISQSQSLFQQIIEAQNLIDISKLLQLNVTKYWQIHYNFYKQSAKVSARQLGTTAIHSIVINAFAPLVFTYGKIKDEPELVHKAIDWLQNLPAEQNNITTEFSQLGMPNKNAAQSQAIIQLYKHYCANKACLNCGIGNKILKNRVLT
ncbi:MAG: DUF2851 family protein [Bacteroidota bacterium]|nr:DUF2851 family protein [Bacteroidota bacterium]